MYRIAVVVPIAKIIPKCVVKTVGSVTPPPRVVLSKVAKNARLKPPKPIAAQVSSVIKDAVFSVLPMKTVVLAPNVQRPQAVAILF